VRRAEAAEEGEATGAVASLLAQLSLGGGLRALAGPAAAPRQLPRGAALQVAELADQQDAVGVDHRQHPDGEPDVQHPIRSIAAVGEPPRVLAPGQRPHLAEGPRADEPPRLRHRPAAYPTHTDLISRHPPSPYS